MSRFRLEGTARGVSRDALYGFYIDFRDDDTETLRSVGVDPAPRSRHVRKEGDTIRVDQEMVQGKRLLPYRQQITLHPSEFTYDVVSEIPGMMRDRRHYVFEGTPGGSRVRADWRVQVPRPQEVRRGYGRLLSRGGAGARRHQILRIRSARANLYGRPALRRTR